jgi:hypothetical protein
MIFPQYQYPRLMWDHPNRIELAILDWKRSYCRIKGKKRRKREAVVEVESLF